MARRVKDNGVGVLSFDRNARELNLRRQIENRDGIFLPVTGEALIERGGDRHAVHARRIPDSTDDFLLVQIKDLNLGRVRNVKFPRGGINGEVIPAAISGNDLLIYNLIGGLGGKRANG